uniref:Uncharacterized protein n=2 Tax=Panagrolaimus sp. JU765 TaxID=591449 RepID=A0AC34RFZ6_9BILA
MSMQDTKITVPYYPPTNEENINKNDEIINEKQPLIETDLGSKVELESETKTDESVDLKAAAAPVANVEENSDVQRQMSTSNDEYEIVSSNSKQTSEIDEKDKTPTPPEIEVTPPPSSPTTIIDIPEIPEITKTPDIFDVEKSTNEKIVSKTYPSIWSKIFSVLNAFMNWIKWVWAQ